MNDQRDGFENGEFVIRSRSSKVNERKDCFRLCGWSGRCLFHATYFKASMTTNSRASMKIYTCFIVQAKRLRKEMTKSIPKSGYEASSF